MKKPTGELLESARRKNMDQSPLDQLVPIETIFWEQALLAPPIPELILEQDEESDHFTYFVVAAEIGQALDRPPGDYSGSYLDYVSAVAAEAMKAIDKWERDDEFGRSCRRVAFYTSLSRYVEADTTGNLPYSVLLETLGQKLQTPLLWEVLEEMVKAPKEKTLKALNACMKMLQEK
jgi:hypothetical protein